MEAQSQSFKQPPPSFVRCACVHLFSVPKLKSSPQTDFDSDSLMFLEVCFLHVLLVVYVYLSQAKGKERQWLKNQALGELDDAKIIDGLTGEKAIYKRRGELEPEVCGCACVCLCKTFLILTSLCQTIHSTGVCEINVTACVSA